MSGSWARFKGDLPRFALFQVGLLLANVLLAKVMAVRYAYPSAPIHAFVPLFFRTLAYDLSTIAFLCVLVLLGRRARVPDRLRGAALVAIYLGFWLVGSLYYLDAGSFMRFGAPLSRDLLRMVLPLFAHASKVIAFDDPLLMLGGLSLFWPGLVTLVVWSPAPRLPGDAARRTRFGWFMAAALALAAVLSFALPVQAQRERTLRRIAPVTLILPTRPAPPSATLSAGQERVLQDLLGQRRRDGVDAFARLPRKRRNVVLWVWESVGERYLKSHHPLGRALSPQLDRLEARGGVRFSNAYIECPLSAQSTFTLMSGMSPPADPRVYATELSLPLRAPFLPALLKARGYHTAFLNSSFLRAWGELRFLRGAGLDVLEDADSFPHRSLYQVEKWSIEGRALVDRFFDWRDHLPSSDPFFAVIWNVESHFPYRWIGMPEAVRTADDLTRYEAAIAHTDRLLGAFFDGLMARKLDGDTLIVVVGDHGQGLGRGDQPQDRFESMLVREDDIHVPLAFLHGDLPPGARVVDTPATLADLYPTVLDLLGLPVPDGIDGSSLVRDYQPRVAVARAMTWWPLAARAGRFKLVVDHREDPPELYDVVGDPWEVADVSGRHPEITDALGAFLGVLTTRRSRDDPSFALFSSADWPRD